MQFDFTFCFVNALVIAHFFWLFNFSYGVTSVPEVTEWQPVSKNDSYLVVASDGIFEKMTVDDVCDLLWDAHKDMGFHPLANYIVNTAYEKGSMDNLAAVVFTLTNALERSKPRPCTEVASYKPQGLSLSKKPGNLFVGLTRLLQCHLF